MPFTGSHPAAALALRRLGLPISAVVVGTVTPDLPYFVPLPVRTELTHSLPGLVGADLLLGVGAFLVWHLVLVRPLVWAAPGELQRRVPDGLRGGLLARYSSAADWARVCAAVLVGGATHLLWDAFTHPDMWVARAVPAMNTVILHLELTRWLHLASSVAGLAILGWFLHRWWQQAPLVGSAEPVRPALRWSLVGALLGVSAWAAGQVAVTGVLAPGPTAWGLLFIDALVTGMTVLLLGLIAMALGWHVVRAVRAQRVQRARAQEAQTQRHEVAEPTA